MRKFFGTDGIRGQANTFIHDRRHGVEGRHGGRAGRSRTAVTGTAS